MNQSSQNSSPNQHVVKATILSRVLGTVVPEDMARLSSDTVYYGLGKTAEALAALILIPVLTRALSPAEFGLWDVVMTFFLLTTTVGSLSIEPAVATLYYETQRPEERKLVVSTGILFRLLSSIVLTVPLFVFSPQISEMIFGGPEHFKSICIVAAAMPFFLLMNLQKQLFRIDFAPGKFNLLSIGFAGMYAALSIVLVVKTPLGVNGVLTGLLASAICVSVIGWALTLSRFSLEFSGRVLRRMLVVGLPLIPFFLSTWVIDSSSRYFLTRLSTLEQVGIYSVGVKISSIVGMFVMSFQMAWAPVALSIQHETDAKERYSRGVLFFFVVSLTVGTAITVFGRQLLMLLAHPKYYGAEDVIGMLVLAMIAFGAFLVLSAGLLIAKRTVYASVAIVAGAAVNLLLNLLLIPDFGIVGAAVATLCAYSLTLLLIYRFVQKFYPVDYAVRRIAGLVALSVATMVVSRLLGFETSPVTDLLVKALIMAGFLVCVWRVFLPGTARAVA
ncbi:MAG: oligosaccharide flippase family protein [Candidatus Abyssubacteria bacterium]